MKKHFLILLLFLFTYNIHVFSQPAVKQQNTPGSELYADAPYRLVKYQNNGTLNSIPIHFYIHDSNSGIYNNELAYIDIKVKNANDSSFTHLLTFNYLSNTDYKSLFLHPSVSDTVFGIQDFWESKPQKSSQHTIIFTKDFNIWLPPIPYVDIHMPYFYFTFLIPGGSLISYEDVIDFEICFGLDWAPDEYIYLRVNRTEESFPKIPAWYRGDVHYHGMFTQNAAENGLPLEATKLAAQCTGLDWITITDHSCDFDNYGVSMTDNWNRLGQIISQLNATDTSFKFIRGLEMSLNNANNNIVHALIYPCDTAPFSLPFIADGGGDLSPTSMNITKMIDSLQKYDAFSYAAHPFAEKDALPSLINGGIWNLNDSLLNQNGAPHPSSGTIISNNFSIASDIYDASDSLMIKANIKGGEIWNYWNSLITDNNPYNPWNVMYESNSGFWENVQTSSSNHYYRLMQSFDVYKTILRRGLLQKNMNNSLKNWKFFLSGGSDAHGDFNYSNTPFQSVLSIPYEYVNDNALGKISTLAYCPNGMGPNGENVLKALRNGNTTMSSGPILLLSIIENGQQIAIPGDDISINNLFNVSIKLDMLSNNEYGTFEKAILYLGTQHGEIPLQLPYFPNTTLISFNFIQNYISPNEWFYVRAELETKRIYSYYEAKLFKKNISYFHAYTNPIWIKGNVVTATSNFVDNEIKIYPNPAEDVINVSVLYPEVLSGIEILSITGEISMGKHFIDKSVGQINIAHLSAGIYILKATTGKNIVYKRFIKR